MRSIAAALMLLALSAFLSINPVSRVAAYETWCADDPIISVGGRVLEIQVQMPVAEVASMRSTMLTVIIPQNVSGSVLVDDISAFPMQTSIVPRGPKWDGTGPLPVRIVVEVTASHSYPVRVVATPLAGLGTPLASSTTVTGSANTRIELELALGT